MVVLDFVLIAVRKIGTGLRSVVQSLRRCESAVLPL